MVVVVAAARAAPGMGTLGQYGGGVVARALPGLVAVFFLEGEEEEMVRNGWSKQEGLVCLRVDGGSLGKEVVLRSLD